MSLLGLGASGPAQALLALVLFSTAACNSGKVGSDTAGDTAVTLEPDCELMDGEPGSVAPGLGWGSSAVCTFAHAGSLGTAYDLSDKELVGLQVKGLDSSPLPSYDVRVVVDLCDPSFNDSCDYPNEYNLYSDDLSAASASGGWLADGSGKLGNLNSKPRELRDSTHVEIRDTTRAAAAPNTCGYYTSDSDAEVQACFDWSYTSRRMAPVNSTCSAGSGEFQLVPRRRVNKDNDSSSSLSLVPVQISGSGTMTSAAWINQIHIVEDQGATLRVVKLNKSYAFSSSDHLVAPLDTVALMSSTTTFANGVLTGGAPFVVEEVPNSTTNDFRVDMTWTCDTLGDTEVVSPPQGYTFSLSDLGCYGSWPQKITIRPVPYGDAQSMQVELYGMVWGDLNPKLVENDGERDFSFSRSGLQVSGALLSYDGQGASIRLDSASYLGVNLCSTGTYSINPEE